MDYISDDSHDSSEEEPTNEELKSDSIWLDHKNKPDKFAYGILSASSDSYDYYDLEQASEALQEWEFIKHDYEADNCICSQVIHQRYWIRNRYTDHVAIIGSECVKKLKTDDLNLWSQINFSMRSQGKSQEEHKHLACVSCCKYNIKKPESGSNREALCKTCVQEGKHQPSKNYLAVKGIPCKGCGEKILASSGTYCYNCLEDCKLCDAKIDPGTLSKLCSSCEEEVRIRVESSSACEKSTTPQQTVSAKKSIPIQQIEVVRKPAVPVPSIQKQTERTTRSCILCSAELPSDFAKHQTRCWDCYCKDNNIEVGTKSTVLAAIKCTSCKCNLPPNTGDYGNRCMTCYRKENNMKICPHCLEVKKFFSLEAWCKMCLDCHGSNKTLKVLG